MPDKLKKGWRSWRFDQMAYMVNDRIDDPSEANVEHYVGLEHLDSDSLTIRRWGSPSDVEATKLCFCKGDIIFGRRRVYQRKLAVAPFDGICSAHAMVLRPKTDVALPEFLPFFMQSDLFMERAKQISVGSLSPTINWKTLAAEEFALPPLDEQRRITEVLGAVDSAIECLVGVSGRALASARALAQSSMLQFQRDGARMHTLDEIGPVTTGRTPSSTESGCWGNSIPFVTPGDMGFVEPHLRTAERGLTKHGADHSVVVPSGTVLVVCIGSTIGKVARCEVPVSFNQQINAITPRDVNSTYLFMCLLECGQQLASSRATTAVPIVNKSSFSQIRIPVPSVESQRRTAECFAALLAARDQSAQRIKDCRGMKEHLMHSILAGES